MRNLSVDKVYFRIFKEKCDDVEFCNKGLKYLKRMKLVSLICLIFSILLMVIVPSYYLKSKDDLSFIITLLIFISLFVILFIQYKDFSKNIKSIKSYIKENIVK